MRDRYVFPSQDFVRSKGTNSNVIALNFNEIGRISAVQILIISTERYACISLYPYCSLSREITVNTEDSRRIRGIPRSDQQLATQLYLVNF